MANRPVPMKWFVAIGAMVLFGILAYSSLQQTQKEYEVCVTFNGASHCARATGATSAQAIQSAQEIDCQLLTNGRDEDMACMQNSPSSLQEIK